MKFHELTTRRQIAPKRAGRGISAGRGKTAGRGTKGQGARKSPVRVGFEGGQTPLTARIPKLPGFKSHRIKPENVYTAQLDSLKSSTINPQSLAEAGLISSPFVSVKLILKGELKSKKVVELQAASKGAIKAVEKASGTFKQIERMPRPKTKSSN